jgi:hypothetical protein
MSFELIAVDPGPVTSAFFVMLGETPSRTFGILQNESLKEFLRERKSTPLAIEMIASYGMPVGREVFETCVWIGRFLEAHSGAHQFVYRKDVRLHLCNSPRANDASIRQALIDKFGQPGTKKNPGVIYGVTKDVWSALAIGVTAAERKPPHPSPRETDLRSALIQAEASRAIAKLDEARAPAQKRKASR